VCAKIENFMGTPFFDAARANNGSWFNPVPVAVCVKVIYVGVKLPQPKNPPVEISSHARSAGSNPASPPSVVYAYFNNLVR
jgi:hypothetical protein